MFCWLSPPSPSPNTHSACLLSQPDYGKMLCMGLEGGNCGGQSLQITTGQIPSASTSVLPFQATMEDHTLPSGFTLGLKEKCFAQCISCVYVGLVTPEGLGACQALQRQGKRQFIPWHGRLADGLQNIVNKSHRIYTVIAATINHYTHNSFFYQGSAGKGSQGQLGHFCLCIVRNVSQGPER